MSNSELLLLVEDYLKGNTKNFLDIYRVFENLIIYYSKKANSEDIKSELALFLIELMYIIPFSKFQDNTDDTLQRYIAICIKNKYISLSKQKQKYESSVAELKEEIIAGSVNFDENYSIQAEIFALSDKQRKVIIMKYIYKYTDCEISESLHISRQAVNRLKIRGLDKLKDKLIEFQD